MVRQRLTVSFGVILSVVVVSAQGLAQQRPAQPQPIVIKPGERPEDVCRNDLAKLTCDIASLPRRGAITTVIGVAIGNADFPNTIRDFNNYDGVIRAMKEGARQGWVADSMIGELAARGISRVRFQQENGQTRRDAQGNPIIERDRAQDLAARIVGSVLDNPNARELTLGQGISPININKPRVCVAAFADVNMRLQLSTETQGQPMSVTSNKVAQLVNKDRALVPDARLQENVAKHLANIGNIQKLEEVVADCGQLALRQLHDEGFRYTGSHMTISPRH